MQRHGGGRGGRGGQLRGLPAPAAASAQRQLCCAVEQGPAVGGGEGARRRYCRAWRYLQGGQQRLQPSDRAWAPWENSSVCTVEKQLCLCGGSLARPRGRANWSAAPTSAATACLAESMRAQRALGDRVGSETRAAGHGHVPDRLPGSRVGTAIVQFWDAERAGAPVLRKERWQQKSGRAHNTSCRCLGTAGRPHICDCILSPPILTRPPLCWHSPASGERVHFLLSGESDR